MKKFLLMLIVLKSTISLFSQAVFTVKSGATLKTVNDARIIINNMELVNNGTIQQSKTDGAIKFTGNANTSISGSNTATLGRLELALDPGSVLSLQSDIRVDSDLVFINGLLNLNNYKLDLGNSGALINESESSRIYTTGTGYVETIRTLNIPTQTNPGNLGAIITSSSNLGATIVRRGNKEQNNVYNNNNSIQRYYDIIPANNATLNATLRFRYFDAELNGLSEDTIGLWRSNDNILWSSVGFNTRNTFANYVEKTGIANFSRLTLSKFVNPASLRNISISNPATITEGNSGLKELKFVVRLNSASASAISVQYNSVDSTAIGGNDYTSVSGVINFAPGQLTDTIRVFINGDGIVEPDEYLIIQLNNPLNGTITAGKAIGTIRNDDAYPSVAITNYNVPEGNARDTTLLIQVRLTKGYALPVSLNYTTEDSTAIANDDYISSAGILTFNPGDTLAYIPVTIKADRIDEPNEIININLSNIVNATAAANLRGRITINDDDLLPQLIFTNVSIAEGSSEIFTNTVFTVRLNRSYPLPVSIAYTTQDSTATSGSDYQLTSGTLTFEPGDTLETITIPVYGDRIAESNEIIKLQFSNAMNATVATTPYRITITNDDVLPQIVFANSSIAEGSNDQFTSQDFTIRLNKSYPLPVTVNYSTQDSSAVNGSDYQAVNGTITFMPGDTLETISIPVLGDRVVEPGEIIKLVFSDATNATITATVYRITITNDDAYPAVTITNISVTEGDAGFVNAAFAVRINKQYPQNITVQYATQDATAIAGLDYTAANGTVTFPADGDLLQVVNIPVSGDLIDEVNETFKLQLSLPSNATISGTGAATATITDNDPVPAIRVYDTIATEASGNASLRIALNSVSGREVKVVYKTQEGSALDTLDYIRIAADTLVFQPGETQKYINVTVLADATVEGNETFSVILQSPVNATVTASQGGDNTGVVTIQNSTGSGSRTTNGLIVKNANEDKWIADTLKVSVSPNPFRFNTLFTVTSPESGDMRIVIFSINGARIAEQKRDVQKGMPVNVHFNDFSPRQGLLIYKIFINGKDKHSGKLIQLN